MVSVNSRKLDELRQSLDAATSQLNLAGAKEKDRAQHEAVIAELVSIENLIELRSRVEDLLPEFGEDLLKMLNAIREERKSVREEYRGEYEKTEKRIMRALEATRKIKRQ